MSTDAVAQTRQLVDEYRQHVEGTFNAERAKALLPPLKIAMMGFDLASSDSNLVLKQAFLSREILELAVLHSVKAKDQAAFERYFAQLKPFYFDYKLALPESERKQPLLGLFLLYLLAEGRIGDFHTELEIIHDYNDRYIKFSIELERDIMEGRYNKVWTARENAPRDTYLFFVEKLMSTIRKDVASCMEASYECLTVPQAAKLLLFQQPTAEFTELCNERGWIVDGNEVTFAKPSGQVELPSTSLINDSLAYAHEIERII